MCKTDQKEQKLSRKRFFVFSLALEGWLFRTVNQEDVPRGLDVQSLSFQNVISAKSLSCFLFTQTTSAEVAHFQNSLSRNSQLPQENNSVPFSMSVRWSYDVFLSKLCSRLEIHRRRISIKTFGVST